MKGIVASALPLFVLIAGAFVFVTISPQAAGGASTITLWEPLVSSRYATYEKIALITNVFVALAGLLYALLLVKQVRHADQGTARMKEIANAVREVRMLIFTGNFGLSAY